MSGRARDVSADLRGRLAIPADRLDELNAFLLDPGSRVVSDILAVIARYGTPEEINRKARAAGELPALLDRVRTAHPAYLADLEWLAGERDRGAFVSVADFRRGVVGAQADTTAFRDDMAVTLEVSALQYFPWVVAAARKAIAERSLMPARWIQVRRMKEQEADGDLPAIAAAMQIIGASLVETLDTKGTDGSNIHLGGPATITGYFGGIGEPNDHPLLWLDEFLSWCATLAVLREGAPHGPSSRRLSQAIIRGRREPRRHLRGQPARGSQAPREDRRPQRRPGRVHRLGRLRGLLEDSTPHRMGTPPR
jgi:hypothetical protein